MELKNPIKVNLKKFRTPGNFYFYSFHSASHIYETLQSILNQFDCKVIGKEGKFTVEYQHDEQACRLVIRLLQADDKICVEFTRMMGSAWLFGGMFNEVAGRCGELIDA